MQQPHIFYLEVDFLSLYQNATINRRQAIVWANVDQVILLAHNEHIMS